MLIDQDGVAIGVDEHEARGAGGGLVGGGGEGEPARLEGPLELAHVVEVGEGLAVAIPAGIEGQEVPVEHPLEETEGAGLVLQDEPVLGRFTADDLEAELLVERA